MQAYKIHIPVKFNDGTDVPDVLITKMLDKALDTFGGYTYNPLFMQGAWKDDKTGKVYEERMRSLEIATDCAKDFKAFVKELCKAFDQECMYVVNLGAVEFVS